MYKRSDFTKKYYKTGEVAKILNLTKKTIQNYDNSGKLKFIRTSTNYRLMTRDDLLEYLDNEGLLCDSSLERRDVIYARVSSNEQKTKGDLDRQAMYLIEHVDNLINPLVLKEVGSGLNDKRKKLIELINLVCNDQVRNVYVTYKDRLTRFGFNYLSEMFKAHNVEIIVVKDINEENDVKEELVEDMMSLIASFSGKFYGMRSKTNKGRK